ncbi:FeoA family protein [Derxia gummosa]|uniref:FeoA family protein n=1 Tax=Derxia gummosa DSM 723 TaxID=1121388 RepID=A0A8B6XAI9_9BURK|nr:FeoA family protein [Derxia gummosa]
MPALSQLRLNTDAIVSAVHDAHPDDVVARRLRDLGFVCGEVVRVIAVSPIGADPIVVQVGFTRFALRKSEADRVSVQAIDARLAA